MRAQNSRLIVHVITGLGIGGAEKMLARVVERSRGFLHEVVVLAEKGPLAAKIEGHGVRVHAMNATSHREGLVTVLRLRRKLTELRPLLVQSWLVHANIATSIAVPRGTKLIWNVRHTLDGFETERLSTRLMLRASAIASRRSAGIFYNSLRAAIQHEAIGYSPEKRFIIPNGFDLAAHQETRRERGAMRSRLGIADDEILIGLIARAHPIKNHGGFLEAAEMVAHQFPKARFLLAGSGTERDGALARRYSGSIRERTLWLGERADVLEITGALDVACNVSHGEAFSNTLGEAMAAGVPCIATDVGESASIIGDCGWLVPDAQAVSIAEQLRRALGADEAERQSRGRCSRERMAALYSIDSIVTRYEETYEQLCGT